MRKLRLSLWLFVFPFLSVYSQQTSDANNRQMVERQKEYSQTVLMFLKDSLGLEWNIPSDWTKEFICEGFDKDAKSVLPGYRIVSPKRNVVIAYDLSYQGSDKAKFLENLAAWKKKKKDLLSEHPDIVYSSDYALTNFGADCAGRFPHKVDGTDKDFNTIKYTSQETVWFFNVEKKWLVCLYYFYVPGTDIDKYIKETAGMLRFKEKSRK